MLKFPVGCFLLSLSLPFLATEKIGEIIMLGNDAAKHKTTRPVYAAFLREYYGFCGRHCDMRYTVENK
jgi:hypothetical protein